MEEEPGRSLCPWDHKKSDMAEYIVPTSDNVHLVEEFSPSH